MTLTIVDFETGPQNAALTLANSGATPTLNGGSAVFDSAMAFFSSLFGAKYTNVSGAICQSRYTITTPSLTMSFVVGYTSPTGTPGENETFFAPRSTGYACYLRHTTANELALYDAAGANKVVLLTGVPTVPTKYRITLRLVAATTTTGTYSINVYAGNSTTPLNGSVITASSYNLGTTAFSAWDQGRVGGVTVGASATHSVGIDYVGYNDGSTTEIGVPGAGTAPTVNAGVDQYILAGSTMTLSASSTGSPTHMWTTPSIPEGAASPVFSSRTVANPTVTGLVAGVYTFRDTVTNTAGSALDDMVAWVYPASTADVQVNRGLTTSWISEGGAASIAAALNNLANPAQRMVSPEPAAGQDLPVVMNPFGPGNITIYVGTEEEGGDVTMVTSVFLENDTTLVYQSAPYALTDPLAEYPVIIDAGGLAILGTDLANRRALRVHNAGTAA